jgi:1-acyl-sn-glycerol-3-phosphate acyltransferase
VAVSSVPVPARSWMSDVFPPLWRRDPELLWPYLRRWTISPAHRVLARSAGYGAAPVPLEGGIVLAANHLSAIDPTLLGAFVPRAVYYMAKVELLALPFLGEIFQWTGAFPVRRSEGDRQALRLAPELVADGHALGMFVEGTRQRLDTRAPSSPVRS